PEVSLVCRNLAATVRRRLAIREQRPDGIHVGPRQRLRLGTAYGTHPVVHRVLAPVGSRRKPAEVDVPRIGAPADILGGPSVNLGPAHHVRDGKVERTVRLGLDSAGGGGLRVQDWRCERAQGDGRKKGARGKSGSRHSFSWLCRTKSEAQRCASGYLEGKSRVGRQAVRVSCTGPSFAYVSPQPTADAAMSIARILKLPFHPESGAEADRATREFGYGLARAMAGGIIFSLPMLMTQEMWRLGQTIPAENMALLLVVTLPLLFGLSRLSG